MAYDPYQMYKSTFGVGARVKVVNQRKYPNEKLLGLVGTVRSDSGTNIAVILDGITNTRSSYGCFYFKPNELIAVDDCNNGIMEEKHMAAVTNYLNIARVKYINACKDSVFQFANFESDLRVDDLCVVRSENDALLVAKVVEIVDSQDIEMYREVVAKVYTESYETRIQCRARAAELKSKMEARAKQLQDIALYKMLAANDPDMANLLNEYQAIPKV